jgi:hypothetical protein
MNDVETLDDLPVWKDGQISPKLVMDLYNRMQREAAERLGEIRRLNASIALKELAVAHWRKDCEAAWAQIEALGGTIEALQRPSEVCG